MSEKCQDKINDMALVVAIDYINEWARELGSPECSYPIKRYGELRNAISNISIAVWRNYERQYQNGFDDAIRSRKEEK